MTDRSANHFLRARQSHSRVVVIGLDGATFDLIVPWSAQGHLPHIGRLAQNGFAAPMRSTLHPYTAQAWTTMTTGVNAGQHRIFDFWERDFDRYGFKLIHASYRDAPAIWSYLTQQGRKSICVNVPMTFPPEPIDGVMISGRDTPGLSSSFTHPPELKSALESYLGRPYIIVPDDWRYMQLGRPDDALQALLDEIDTRFDTVEWLMSRYEWDFCMFVTSAPDGAAHYFWKYLDLSHPLYRADSPAHLQQAILAVYQRCDQRIGRLIKHLPPETGVMIVSDHGSGSEPQVVAHINAWLESQGLLTRRAPGPLSIAREFAGRVIAGGKRHVRRQVSFQTLSRIRRLWPDNLRARLDEESLFGDLNWTHVKAFSEERRGNIWLNVRGRDPMGIVEPGEEYESIREHIVREMPATLLHPLTGEPVVRRVWRREELFDGPWTDRMPDLIVESTHPDVFKRGRRGQPPCRLASAAEMSTWPTSGGHRQNGIFIANGPGIRPGFRNEPIPMTVPAPTIFHWMGLPVPACMGDPLAEMFQPEWLEQHPVSRAPTAAPLPARLDATAGYSNEEAQAVEERLRALGYMD